MADPEVRISHGEESEDFEMQGDGEDLEVGDTSVGDASFADPTVGDTAGDEPALVNGEGEKEDGRAGAEEEKSAPNDTFVEYVPHAVVMLASCHFD